MEGKNPGEIPDVVAIALSAVVGARTALIDCRRRVVPGRICDGLKTEYERHGKIMKGRLARREYADLAYTGVGLLSRCVYTLFTCDLVRESRAGASRRDRTKQYVNRWWGRGAYTRGITRGDCLITGIRQTRDVRTSRCRKEFQKKKNPPRNERLSIYFHAYGRIRKVVAFGTRRKLSELDYFIPQIVCPPFRPSNVPGARRYLRILHLMVFMGAGRQNQRRFFINGVANVGR